MWDNWLGKRKYDCNWEKEIFFYFCFEQVLSKILLICNLKVLYYYLQRGSIDGVGG